MRIKKTYFYSVLLIIFTGFVILFILINASGQHTRNGSPVNADEVSRSAAKEEITIVDVRTPEEYKTGHLEDSILLPLVTINTKAGEILPDKNRKLFVYCRTGHRSAQAVETLMQMGYTDVHSMDGGITSWQNSGYPLK